MPESITVLTFWQKCDKIELLSISYTQGTLLVLDAAVTSALRVSVLSFGQQKAER